MHSAKIILDSVSQAGARLTTMEVVMPRIILAEYNTHRVFSRNSASSRAIPFSKMVRMAINDPYIPTHWGLNQSGMQADKVMSDAHAAGCKVLWLEARDNAVASCMRLADYRLHKQIINRLLEPFLWHTVICSATTWRNFFNLRCHKDAHPDMQLVANAMRASYTNSVPVERMWHLPYLQWEDEHLDHATKIKISVARCARVSYLNHDGIRDIGKDVDLYSRLAMHLSPYEHVAQAAGEAYMQSGNYSGWIQHRKTVPNESNILEVI